MKKNKFTQIVRKCPNRKKKWFKHHTVTGKSMYNIHCSLNLSKFVPAGKKIPDIYNIKPWPKQQMKTLIEKSKIQKGSSHLRGKLISSSKAHPKSSQVDKSKVNCLTKRFLEPFAEVEPPSLFFFAGADRKQINKNKRQKEENERKCKVMGTPITSWFA